MQTVIFAGMIVVLALPPRELFERLGSVECSASRTVEAATENAWGEGVVHVTDQDAGIGVAVDIGSEVSFTNTGFVEDVVQSPGMVRLIVLSAFAGVEGPLLCRVAVAETVNGAKAPNVPGLDTDRALTFRSAVAPMAVVAEPLAWLFVVFVSVRCS